MNQKGRQDHARGKVANAFRCVHVDGLARVERSRESRFVRRQIDEEEGNVLFAWSMANRQLKSTVLDVFVFGTMNDMRGGFIVRKESRNVLPTQGVGFISQHA